MSEIDVSKCKHYKNKNCIADYLLTDMPFSEAKCELSPNCYYKQLQQLKAENEELKDTIKEMEDDLDDWISDVSILFTYDDGKPNNLYELQCCMEHAHEEWSKYKQCLGEIEEIIRDFHLSMIIFHKGTTHEMANRIDWHLEKIQQLIKEVKGNDI